LAYNILDTNAQGAILVSPMGFQKGAKKVAAAENIIEVKLPATCTATDFVIQFFNKICVGMTMKAEAKTSVAPRLVRACAQCGTTYPKDEHPTLCSNCR
jgi:Zn finger protein HypA/HybF involved in hydrogenase expression